MSTTIQFRRPEKPAFGLFELYGAIGLLALLVARFVPLARWVPFWGCEFRRVTGIPCLSCGMTRSFDWFMQGRLLDSLAVSPIGFLLACLSVGGVGYLVARPLRPPRLRVSLDDRAARAARWSAVGILVVHWAYLVARELWMA